jgi:hypothetical protein
MNAGDVTKRGGKGIGGIARIRFAVCVWTILAAFTPLVILGDTPPGKSQVVDQNLTITADTNPYVLNGDLTVSGDGPRKEITLSPGVEMRGGTINLGRQGTLILQGTKNLPVVLRNVTVTQDLGGDLKAEFAVFDKCTFSKGGWWFSAYSSKWEMQSCLLYQCTFPWLTVVDYGIKFRQCVFVSMNFPEVVQAPGPKDKNFDDMKALREDWRTIQGCKFIQCDIPPTLFWCSQSGDYINCEFRPGEAFDSATKTELPAWISNTSGQLPEDVWAGTPALRAAVSVKLQASPFNTANPSPICPIDAITDNMDLMTEIWPNP